MHSFRKLLLPLFGAGIMLATLSAAAAPIVFNFDADTPGTFDSFDTVGGLTMAYFGAVTVCDVSSDPFTLLSGNALITSYCDPEFGSTIIGFSSPLSSLTYDYALDFTDPVDVFYFLDGNLVGTDTLTNDGSSDVFEGTRTFNGKFNGAAFDTGGSFSDYGLDNLSAVVAPVPEPSSIALLGTGILASAGIIRRRFKV